CNFETTETAVSPRPDLPDLTYKRIALRVTAALKESRDGKLVRIDDLERVIEQEESSAGARGLTLAFILGDSPGKHLPGFVAALEKRTPALIDDRDRNRVHAERQSPYWLQVIDEKDQPLGVTMQDGRPTADLKVGTRYKVKLFNDSPA